MIHTYNISGMTCKGCKASVEEALSKLPNIESVSVNLEANEATIKTTAHVGVETLQNALSDKYKISNKVGTDVFATSKTKNESELKQLFPLILIIAYILVASILLNFQTWDTSDFMLDFMGIFFIVFSFFKLLDLKGFPHSFRMYDPLAKVFPFYGWLYPFIETILGLMFLMRFNIDLALIITLLVLSVTTVGVTKTLLDKKSIQCACLGTALKLPMTKATFIENSIMIVMAVIMLYKIAS